MVHENFFLLNSLPAVRAKVNAFLADNRISYVGERRHGDEQDIRP